MSVRLTSKSSSGSIRGPASGSSSVSRMSTVHTSGSYKSPSVHGGLGSKFIGSSYGAGGLGCGSAGSLSSGFGGGNFGYGSAGGFGSGTGSGHGYGGGSYASGGDSVINVSEKETMQILNDRLATYLDKVRSLEQENAQLERKIREWYEKQAPYTSPDFDPFFKAIEDLQGKILQGNAANASLLLQIDNARLASDDFRTKYENEAALRMGVEADISGLKRVQDELELSKKDLEMQYQNLTDELAFLKKNHQEEVNSLRSQLGTKVNVEVDAAPAVDLNKILTELRSQYETIMEQNAKEAERWFIEKSEDLNHQMTSSAQQLQTFSTEIIQLRHSLQNLEIELQTQISLRCALENSLAETESRYSCTLNQLQELINDVEVKLSELRSDLERQNFEYKTLLDVKTHLEMEIATYRKLLDSEDNQRGGGYASRGGPGASITMVNSGGSMNMGGSGGSMSMGGSGGSSSMGSTSGSGSMTNISGRPRTIVEDGYNQSKRE